MISPRIGQMTANTPAGREVTPILMTLVVGVIIALTGCRARANRTQTESGKAAQPVAAANSGGATTTDGKVDGKLVESRSVTVKDEGFDLQFAQEKQETHKLTPGASVRIEGINGKVEIQRSSTESAELSIVRSVEDRADLEKRSLVIEHRPDELVVRMERVRRSALFTIFSDRGREKQRVVLKLPQKVKLDIEGINGRLNVRELDGDVNIEGANGRVFLSQVSGKTSLSGINGPVRVLADGKNEIKVEGVNGAVDLLFTGQVNADLRVEGVFGSVDLSLPNLVYDGERRQNNFRAKVGKGGTELDISSVRGRLRLAPATEKDLAAPVTASAK